MSSYQGGYARNAGRTVRQNLGAMEVHTFPEPIPVEAGKTYLVTYGPGPVVAGDQILGEFDQAAWQPARPGDTPGAADHDQGATPKPVDLAHPCAQCAGAGEVYYDADPGVPSVECPLCGGTGDQPPPAGDHRVTATAGRAGPNLPTEPYRWTCVCGDHGDNRADALAHVGR